VGAGHGCIGCSEPDFWEFGAYNLADIQKYTPPASYAPVEQEDQTISAPAAGIVGGLAGLAIGAAGAAAARRLSQPEDAQEE
jgi:Ni,Fe-hydrogenase I small subunit